MAKPAYHRMCKVCGSPHGRYGICPVKELNAEMESANRHRDDGRITVEKLFAGNPRLIRELNKIQEKWGISPCSA